jgi:hypothetical protein
MSFDEVSEIAFLPRSYGKIQKGKTGEENQREREREYLDSG